MSKRKFLTAGRILAKKQKQVNVIGGSRLSPTEEKITDTLSAIHHVRNIFPSKELGDRFPPIVFKHQLYSLLENRTDVDREVNSLAEKGQIKIFQLGHRDEEFMILLTTDFTAFVKRYHGLTEHAKGENVSQINIPTKGKGTVTRFLNEVVGCVSDISISEEILLNKYGFKDKHLTELVNAGLLTLRNAGCWWFSIPGAGQFVKVFHKGRQAALRMIRMMQFKEILLEEFKKRKPPMSMKLGILYHSYDLVGSDFARCLKSTSGILLRIID